MRAEFIGTTLVVTPETDGDREQLQYYGANKKVRLWECYGVSEDGTLSVQPLCPVGLQDSEIMDHIRFFLEVE